MSFPNRSQFAIFSLAILGLLSPDGHPVAQDFVPDESRLSIHDVLRVMHDEDWILVDTRETDAYNGWALDGNQRGGHIPHAVDFPASWLDVDRRDKAEILATALRTKGIERNKHVVLYSTNERDRQRVASYLREAAFRQVYFFDFKDWVADGSRPLIRYKAFHLLLPASIVKSLLDGRCLRLSKK